MNLIALRPITSLNAIKSKLPAPAIAAAKNEIKDNQQIIIFNSKNPFNFYDILNNLDEIVDVTNVTIENETGGLYSDESLHLKEYISADGRILYAPENVIYEIKYPNRDIKGTIR